MRTYEELIKITDGRVEAVDEAMQMNTNKRLDRLYGLFGETGDLEVFEEVCNELYKITGTRF
jgi:hypothetical protein